MDHYQKQIYNRIQRFVPQQAVDLAYALWEEKPFRFVISKARNTKLGDFRFHKKESAAVITVNENLAPENFLITYVHEVAHHWVYDQYQHRVQAHGIEWKKQFQELMMPFLSEDIFSAAVLKELKRHMRNPKASSQSDLKLCQALRKQEKGYEALPQLSDLSVGDTFKLENRIFQVLEFRRTRVRCQEIASKKNYLVHKLAEVEAIEA